MTPRTHKRRSRRRAGYTLIEVMMALGVLTAGSVGIMALVQASTRGNMEAREMATATEITRVWMERLRRDSTNWTASSRTINPVILARTSYLRQVPNPGTASLWFVPVPPVGSTDSPTFDFYGRDTTVATERYFCTNVRLEWLYVGRAVRADVRVWWLRRVSGSVVDDPGRAALGQCAPGTDPNTLTNDWRVRMTYASTIVRYMAN
ncbi:MAG: prepilin-type N-terminal cleavage/methylation domain-containing protein [Sandaracinaceae bacterium]|nr:prepilin-type N-terminal cleavage/methylation domain-containing protein [Sandaracinaceae bacterium]